MLTPQDQTRLDALYASMKEATEGALGYPVARDFDYAPLYRFLQFPANNIGDPFQASTYRVGSREMEREVIDFFAAMFKAPANDYWGYVTNGGTEGNLYGLYLARELYPNGIVYFSEETHYSVAKNVHFLGLRHIMIRAQKNGEIDYEDLKESIRLHRDVPAIIFANIGTTMKEGRDDIRRIQEILRELVMRDHYIHSDAAFCGPFAQFLEPKPAFDFADGADSIALSGHKFIGAPMPCGVVIARKRNVERIGRSIGYIGSMDTTITGSRNAFTPLILWYAVKSMGEEGLRKRLARCQELAGYAVAAMNARGIAAWRNENALTVVFPRVSDTVKNKWQLATQDVSHLIVAPGTSKALIDALIADIVEEQA
ncbi:histidine decarboxylase [Noviherbaspirillum denitrificans]|uniref:Histidine decarboxylase n=1 Tax=Noviherbaspirillum denitrificans TaxID=1968433 RepID=A0A254TD32_9BURK|nr:histidine decarboxylase [Noviherbaspirillum denitrificans]OWW18453.1 histidine decarboxylase [Noviherbaspirillum denitrificans]